MLRAATHDDLLRLVELGAAMHAESPTYSRLRFSASKLAATIERAIDTGFAMVCEVEGVVVGGMLGMVVPHWCSDDLVACDLALFMAPEHRGGMAAVRLLNAYRVWAERSGAVLKQIGATTGVNNEAAAQLFERLGWVRSGIILELP